jgi:hypothetical protein
MSLPREFIVVYEAECGEQYEMYNCYLPLIPLFCEECQETHYFRSSKIIHKSWEWDYVEDDNHGL